MTAGMSAGLFGLASAARYYAEHTPNGSSEPPPEPPHKVRVPWWVIALAALVAVAVVLVVVLS